MPIYFIRAYGTSLSKAGFCLWRRQRRGADFRSHDGRLHRREGGARNRGWWVWGPAIGILLAIPFYLYGFNAPSFWSCVLGIMLGNSCLFLYWSPTLAMVQNMSTPQMRTSAAAISGLHAGRHGDSGGADRGWAFSPTFLPSISSHSVTSTRCAPAAFAPSGSDAALTAACSKANVEGLRYALCSTALLFAWGAVHFIMASRHVARDVFAGSAADLVAPAR